MTSGSAQPARPRAAPSRAASKPARGTIGRSKQASARHHRAQQASERAAPSRAASKRARGTISRSKQASQRGSHMLTSVSARNGTTRPWPVPPARLCSLASQGWALSHARLPTLPRQGIELSRARLPTLARQGGALSRGTIPLAREAADARAGHASPTREEQAQLARARQAARAAHARGQGCSPGSRGKLPTLARQAAQGRGAGSARLRAGRARHPRGSGTAPSLAQACSCPSALPSQVAGGKLPRAVDKRPTCFEGLDFLRGRRTWDGGVREQFFLPLENCFKNRPKWRNRDTKTRK